ncbi:2955_t:CDS:2, partial [Acaulospora colombiana]
GDLNVYTNVKDGDLSVYTKVKFSDIIIDRNKGISCQVTFTPPKILNTMKERKEYWNKSKKLKHGNLVCLLWPNEDIDSNKRKLTCSTEYSLFFGTVTRRDEKMLSEEQRNAKIDICFADISVFSIAIWNISRKNVSDGIVKHGFMVESTDLLFENSKSILKTLQKAPPEVFPFERYLAPKTDEVMMTDIGPPIYARAPDFKYDLSVLLNDKNQKLYLKTGDTRSEDNAVRILKDHSKLDETQSQALVSALTREIALIEGPPGTGKSYIGVQILRVLLAEKNNRSSKMGPILTITYTNHALDSFLQSLLDYKIKNIVRMGSRSKSRNIKKFQIEEICRMREITTRRSSGLRNSYHELEKIEDDAKEIIESYHNRWINWRTKSVDSYLREEFPKHYENLRNPNISCALLEDQELQLTDENTQKSKVSTFEQWIRGGDITKAQEIKRSLFKSTNKLNEKDGKSRDTDGDGESSDPNKDSGFQSWLRSWEIPKGKRSLEELKDDCDVWKMSKTERVTLHDFWKENIYLENIEKLEKLKKKHDRQRDKIERIHDE